MDRQIIIDGLASMILGGTLNEDLHSDLSRVERNYTELHIGMRHAPAGLSFADKLTLGVVAFVLIGIIPGFYMLVMAVRQYRRANYEEIITASGEIIHV